VAALTCGTYSLSCVYDRAERPLSVRKCKPALFRTAGCRVVSGASAHVVSLCVLSRRLSSLVSSRVLSQGAQLGFLQGPDQADPIGVTPRDMHMLRYMLYRYMCMLSCTATCTCACTCACCCRVDVTRCDVKGRDRSVRNVKKLSIRTGPDRIGWRKRDETARLGSPDIGGSGQSWISRAAIHG
jgi:hypothetical protein